MNIIKRLGIGLAGMSLLATIVPACVAEEGGSDEELSSVEQHATAVLLAGKYYYKTDDFDEQCGASTLSFKTSPDNVASSFTTIPRGDVTYVKPWINWNGAMFWHCGTWSSSGHDMSECDGPTPNWVRVWWDPNSRRINMKCYRICGDGSSPDDCQPY